MTTHQVPEGFEAAHEEWLRTGGPAFREVHRFGPCPDFYRSRYWKLVKECFLTSKGFKCLRCGGYADQVHHLYYDCRGEDHFHPESLVAVCGPCHGLMEYARNAEALISRISRRISLCEGFLDKSRGCLDQNPVHVCARLLEYQDELAQLRKLFQADTYYRNSRVTTERDAEAFDAWYRQKTEAYEKRAADMVSTWAGTDEEKSRLLLSMLAQEIENCRGFIAEVREPVLPSAERLVSSARFVAAEQFSGPSRNDIVPESAHGVQAVEALVVATKFHRGHVGGLVRGDRVCLLREPNNPHDSNAIKVNLQTGETLGYLTKEYAAVLAAQIDAGVCVDAQISRIVGAKAYVAITEGSMRQ